MRKKFIGVYALMAVLALGTTVTSCVDDNESASVTAIRDAKAKQLESLANYNNAQAEAAKIVAEAEAALKNAKAELQKIKNELEGLELQKAQAVINIEIEAAKTKAEAELLTQKSILEKAKASLILAMDNADAATQERVQNLLLMADALLYGGKYNVYTTSLMYDGSGNMFVNSLSDELEILPANSLYGKDGVKGLTQTLVEKKALRTKADYEMVDIKLEIEQLRADKETELANEKALLAEYEKYNNTDKEAAEKAANEAVVKIQSLQKLNDEAYALLNEESIKVTDATTKIAATELMVAYDAYEKAVGTCSYLSDVDKEDEYITVKYDDGTAFTFNTNFWYQTLKKEVDAEQLSADLTDFENDVKITGKNLKDAQKELEDAQKDDAIDPITSKTYKELKEAVAKAKEAFDKEPTTANENAWKNAQLAVDSYLDLYDTSSEEEAYERAVKSRDALANLQKVLQGDAYKTYETIYAEYEKAVKAEIDAYVAYQKTKHNLNVQINLKNALVNIAAGYTDWAELINTQKRNVNETEKEIATLETAKNETEASKQVYIEALDKEIANLENDIKILQTQYDSCMKKIEAVISGESGLPEIPEGGESTETPETPAE